jgi:hypothetical protein
MHTPPGAERITASNQRFPALGLLVLGLVLLGAGVVQTAAAQTTPACKQDGTDTARGFLVPDQETGSPIGSLKTASKPVDPQLAPSDSVLGDISNSAVPGKTDKGLNTTCEQLVKQAFQAAWWGGNVDTTPGRPGGQTPQIEANFSLFWGVAYMESLRADNSSVDQSFDKPAGRRSGLSASELRGLNLFQSAFGTSHNPQTADGTPGIAAPIVPCNAAPRNDARLERMAMATGASRSCAR